MDSHTSSNDSQPLNVLLIGAGMYTCGRGTDGFGTVLPALFEAAQEYHKSQSLAAWLLGLTIVAAGVLVIPISWVYVNFKRGMPHL